MPFTSAGNDIAIGLYITAYIKIGRSLSYGAPSWDRCRKCYQYVVLHDGLKMERKKHKTIQGEKQPRNWNECGKLSEYRNFDEVMP